ncbi:MAG: hypothetical protein EBU98_02610 [Actinobacteria bacterium]|nr:hypothetical protein [Actinomycetota bacterium]
MHEEVTVTDLRVTGSIPTELTGRYLRNGPNPVGRINEEKYHWFTGHGMVHGIRLRDGKAEWYRNRWVRTKQVCDVLGGTPPPSDWPADHPSFPANTSVIGHAGRTYAIVEGGSPPIGEFGGNAPRHTQVGDSHLFVHRREVSGKKWIR